MRYRILGTTQALREDGSCVPLGGARLRALLTALALAAERTVPTGTLISQVWGDGDEPPADRPAALQALVGRLRRALGRDAVESVEGGYRLAADRDGVDLHRFERLAGEGARALKDGDARKAVGLLDDALQLWRGPALADLPDGSGHAVAVRAEARRVETRRALLAAEVALGHADQALPALRELAAEHPLDEPLQALWLRALRDTGRTAEALAAYEGVRAFLADRLGSDPGPELRALHAELLGPAGGGQSLPAPARPAAPRPRPAGNLRARLTSFVGRDTDLDAIREDLTTHRLLTLLGPGGSGKTRLAQEAAEAIMDGWPDGVWLAELAPVRDPATVAEAVLTAVGGRETVIRGKAVEELWAAADPNALHPLAQLAEHFAARRALLLLDNCEHVIDAAATVAETLLTRCPGVTILATSREPLAVPGESVRLVGPLPGPVALRLLADRGAAARPGFRVDQTLKDAAACAEICRRLDGLPLAIELAAARLRSFTPRQIADRLDDRFSLLTSGSRTVLPRQQTLRAVVDWSWELLDDAERAVLRRLSVFSGGCELTEAEGVCATLSTQDRDAPVAVASREVASLIGSLVDKSLVVAVPAPGGAMRYRLLETVGEYAADRLDEAGERAATEHRHLVTYRELARTTDQLLRGIGQVAALDRLEREHDNIRTALRRAVAAGDEQEALCLALSMNWFWALRDHRSDIRTWASAVAALGPNPFLPPVAKAPPLLERCTDAPPPMPLEQLQEARRGVRLMATEVAEGDLGFLDDPEFQTTLRGVLAAYRPGLPQLCRPPGFAWAFAGVFVGEFVQVQEGVDEAVQSARDLGLEWELAFSLQTRAKMLNDRPEGYEQSARDYAESLEIFSRLGDTWGRAEALSVRAEDRERRGDYAAAAEDYRQAMECARQIGANGQVPILKAQLASVLLEMGGCAAEREQAEQMLNEAVAEAERVGGDALAFTRLQLAIRYGRLGQTRDARELLDQLAEEFAGRGPDLFRGIVLGLLAWMDCIDGRFPSALERASRAVTLTQNNFAYMVAPDITLTQLAIVAWAMAGTADPLDAARILGVYDAQRLVPGGGDRWRQAEREMREAAEVAVRAAVGDVPAYERAYAEGGGLSMEEAAALVPRPRGASR